MSDKATYRPRLRRQTLLRFAAALAVVVLANIVGSRLFMRFDLTAEKRYSIAPSTKQMLKGIDDVVFIRVYLEGDLPADLKKLRNATRELLDEFRAYNRDIEYEFINPYASDDSRDQERLFAELVEKGIEPTNIQQRSEEGVSTRLTFPGAIVTFRDKEMPVQLLQAQENMNVASMEQVNHSIEGLEYNLSNALRKLTIVEKPSIAFVEGHGELAQDDVADISLALSEYYRVTRVTIDGKLNSLAQRIENDSAGMGFMNKFEALIIARPTQPFSKEDQYMIDQFIMRGGKVLWLIDPVSASLDSLQATSETIGIPLDFGLQPMLSTYGVRVNRDLLQDISALPIPVNVEPYGRQPRFEFFPWYFNPIILPRGEHPIVRNLDAIMTQFVSSIDTISSAPAKKTVLLSTSEYTRRLNAPTRISLDIIGTAPDERDFQNKHLAVAVLLEGTFNSMFRFRVIPDITDNPEMDFRKESKPTRMIVISDGDMIRNQMRMANGRLRPLKLGFDRYTGRTFANRDFILNAVNYLCDDAGLLEVRSREVTLRMLDQTKIKGNKRISWQLINVAAPVLILLLAGFLFVFLRRLRYRSTPKSDLS